MVDYSEDAVRDWLNQIDENEFLERVRIKRDEMNFHRWEKIWISILRFCPRKWKKSPWHSSSISVGCISRHVLLKLGTMAVKNRHDLYTKTIWLKIKLDQGRLRDLITAMDCSVLPWAFRGYVVVVLARPNPSLCALL